MSGFVLERSEFLVLMDAVEAGGVIGLDDTRIVPDDDSQHRALIEKGLRLLKERGALREVDDVNILDIDLLSMALLVANPEIAVMTTRDNPGLGQQLFLHYVADEVVVEQTLPTDHEHRWALVPGRVALVERILGILPVKEEAARLQPVCRMLPEEFLTAKRLIEIHEADQARAVLRQQGAADDAIDRLAAAIASPEFGGQVAVLRCERGEVVDGRNLAVVQGGGTAFLIKPVTVDEATLEISECSLTPVRALLTNWLAELSARQN